jgi:hypothetical protein
MENEQESETQEKSECENPEGEKPKYTLEVDDIKQTRTVEDI